MLQHLEDAMASIYHVSSILYSHLRFRDSQVPNHETLVFQSVELREVYETNNLDQTHTLGNEDKFDDNQFQHPLLRLIY